MNDQLKAFLSVLLTSLVDLRKFGYGDGHSYSYVLGMLRAAEVSGVLTYEQASLLRDILPNAANHARHPFPCEENAGPCMPIDVWRDRHKTALEVKARLEKLPALDASNEKPEPVPAPTPRRELRLLCVLAKPQLDTAQGAYLPIHTMHRLPPRAMVKGQWSEPRYSGLHLRETQARQPSAEVLERCLPKRHLSTNGRVSVLGVTL
ncbi:hypothetical protein N5E30_11835 [Pseudomonas chengduensis]|nr:hypothetical protein [Pseudomonas chengduensis]MDH1682268.1 hypothetical protein [Pseudomonas chengduensis]